MSVSELRSLLLGASLGDGAVAAFAKLALDTWGAEAIPAERSRPLTNAEKCARRRLRKQGIEPPPVTRSRASRDTAATPNDTAATPETTPSDTAVGSAPSRALPLSSPGSSSHSSSPAPSPSEPLDPGVSGGSTGAREAAAEGRSAPAESGTFRLVPEVGAPVPTPRATPSDTARDTKRHLRDTGKGHRLPDDWTLDADLVAWTEARGVDAWAILESFRDHWKAESGPKALKSDWRAAFRTWVRKAIKFNDAPMLPEEPEPPAPTGTAESRARARSLFNGIPQGGST